MSNTTFYLALLALIIGMFVTMAYIYGSVKANKNRGFKLEPKQKPEEKRKS